MLGALTGSSLQTGYFDSMGPLVRSVNGTRGSTNDGRARYAPARPDDSGLFTEARLIPSPGPGQTRRRPGCREEHLVEPAFGPAWSRLGTGGSGRVDWFQRRWHVTVAWRSGGRAARIGLIGAILGVA